jgi:Pyridoxamine 5'-phosphate oxidase
VRGIVNDAVPNGTPMSVAHVGEDGAPVLTIRGSVQFYGPAQLSVWLRNPKGGLATAIARDPRVALLYRDSARVVTVSITGHARIEPDEAVRERVYEAMSEFEQTHDPDREGACLIVDIKHLKCQVASQTTTVKLLLGAIHPKQHKDRLGAVLVQPVEDGRVRDEADEKPDRVHAEQAPVAGHHRHIAPARHGDDGRDMRDVRRARPPRKQPGAEPSGDEAEQGRADVRHDDHAHSCPTGGER